MGAWVVVSAGWYETTRKGFFSLSFLIQSAMGVGLSLTCRMTAVAPTTSNLRTASPP